ncbi:MAG: imidazoleglycerol-phosphate dehydratase HisB [Alphaproteobacteria bacterium]|nr:imidazoleglycerol-phosphate dehydratase HisB [Alphaproteobacteria bacterium]
MRICQLNRKTAETEVQIEVNLDGTGVSNINTGCGFFDHMLDQIARHGLIDLTVQAIGDLDVDAHHLVEDVGIVFGQAIATALGDKCGIKRYGTFTLPMDECLSRVAIDLSGRTAPVFHVKLPSEKVGDVDTEVFREFFFAVADNLKAAIHVENMYGENSHHILESCFKAFAHALREAIEIDERAKDKLPSTKECL